jgi:hypothetical protein
MSGRRTTAILAVLAGGALLAGIAAVFLGGDAPAVAPVVAPPSDRPPAERPKTVVPPAPKGRPGTLPVLIEDDAPPVDEMTSLPPDWKSWARLRFLDAKTKEEIPFGRGRIAHVVPRGPRGLLVPEPWRRGEDGRIEVYRSEDDMGLPFGVDRKEWESAPVEVRIPGRVVRRFASRAELAGERDVELVALAPEVRGTVRLAPALAGKKIVMNLEPADPTRDPRGPDAMPEGGSTEPGPFAWYDVPDGRWKLTVWVKVGGGDVGQAVREFDRAGAEVDLGEILVLPPTKLRARVVARNGAGVLDKDLHLQRTGDGSFEIAEEIDDGGWAVFRNLDPDTEYRVVSSLDKLAETVRTPAEGGGDLRVEMLWENEGVRCRLRFTVDGQDPVQWGDLFESPALDKGAWKKDGFLEHDMAAGEYLFGAFARPVGKDAPVRVHARFTVPDQPLWEATIDMTEAK